MYVKIVLVAVLIEALEDVLQLALVVRPVAETIVEPSALAAWHIAVQPPLGAPWNTVGAVAPGLILRIPAEFRPPAIVEP